MNNDNKSQVPSFLLDYGTKPTTSKYEEVIVNMNPEIMLKDFAQAYHNELYRRNPIKAREVNVTVEELESYFTGILTLRIKSCSGAIKEWREMKKLNIPTWIQFVISRVGIVLDAVRGLKFIPSIEFDYNIGEMLDTSVKLQQFIVDGVTMHKDAFPRSEEGDMNVMSMAIIDSYVQSISEIPHPISSYVSAFIGAKIEEEAAFKMLYRVRYDDVTFIKSMLMHEEKLI